MPLLATYFDQFADALGFPPYAVRLVASLLLAYPLGFLFLRLPNDKPAIKHWFSLIAAVFIHFEILEDTLGFLHLSLGALTTYLIAVTVRSSLMPQIVIVLVMLHMSYV
jgi:lysophospholipid acyltransferase